MSTRNDQGFDPGNSPNPLERKQFYPSANLAGGAVVAVAFVLLAALSWRKWPDIIVDFGTQLYIPWRLLHGAVLYRDLFNLNGGPLSQYFNALLFKIFGVSFSTLVAANLCLTAAMLGFIYRRFLAAADALTATTVCLGIVTVFAFSEYVSIGNYNFIAPYSHELLHGVIVSVFVVGVLTDWLHQPRLRQAAGCGFGAGLVFLTKPEVFLALAGCCAAAFVLQWLNRRAIRSLVASAAAFGVAMLLPALFFFLFFLRVEDWRMSLRSVVFGWLPVFNPAVVHNLYYVTITGMDHPRGYLRVMGLDFLCSVLVLALAAIIFRALARQKRGSISPWVIWLAVVSPLLVWTLNYQWVYCGTSLPLWCLASLALLARRLKTSPQPRPYTFPFLWTVFALALMAKLGVFIRIFHYGFALAMPAFAAAVYFLLWLLPAWLESRFQVPAKYLRATVLAPLLIAFALLANSSQHWYQEKRLPIGQGGDVMYAYGPGMEEGDDLKNTLDWVNAHVPADGSMAVIPGGVTLNYLSRRVNPTPCLFWEPCVMAMFGQNAMTSRFEAAAPDYIVLVEQYHSSFGVGYFGSYPGYGVDLMQWIKRNYQVVFLTGNEPLKDGRFGVEILKRLPARPDKHEG